MNLIRELIGFFGRLFGSRQDVHLKHDGSRDGEIELSRDTVIEEMARRTQRRLDELIEINRAIRADAEMVASRTQQILLDRTSD